MMDDHELLTIDEAATLLRMKPSALAQLRYRGGGPIYLRLTAKTIVYRRGDLDAWLRTVAHERTDQPIAAAVS